MKMEWKGSTGMVNYYSEIEKDGSMEEEKFEVEGNEEILEFECNSDSDETPRRTIKEVWSNGTRLDMKELRDWNAAVNRKLSVE